MSHEQPRTARYEKECPRHGWYLDEEECEGCAKEQGGSTPRQSEEVRGAMLRCYCCGEALEGQIALVTMSPYAVDRVFVAKPEHIENFDEESTRVTLVERASAFIDVLGNIHNKGKDK